MKKTIWVSLIGLMGIGLTGFSIFANLFGFDIENDWENGRVSVAAAGGILIFIAILIRTEKYWQAVLVWIQKNVSKFIRNILGWSPIRKSIETIQRKLTSWKTAWNRTPFARWYSTRIGTSRIVRYFSGSQDRQAALVAVLCSIGIIAIYIWYISASSWTQWPTLTAYYDKLSDAFWHKQVSLIQEPPPSLSALVNPYEKENRSGIPYLWDAVFYNGKYYLYWGPIPALLLSAVHIFYSGEIGDQYLVFAFLCGEFLVSVLFLLKLRKTFFPNLNGGWIIPGILMAGLANPLPWLINSPAVYEAAVAGGQFFLILAMYLGFSHATEKGGTNYGKLAAIGFCLACSAASRTSLLPALVFLLFMVAWNIVRNSPAKIGNKIVALGFLGLPFAAGLASLGWYNLVRFGSWFEFGLRYQLTSADLNAIYDHVFSWANAPSNLYIYLLNPFQLSPSFPYIKTYWSIQSIVYPIKSPVYCFFAGPVSGLLLDVPYVTLAMIAIFFMLQEGGKQLSIFFTKQGSKGKRTEDNLLQWTLLTFSGVVLLAFGPVLLFFVVTMRYLADIVPALVLLSTLGSWIGIECLVKKPASKKWFLLLVITLTSLSAVISVLLPASFI